MANLNGIAGDIVGQTVTNMLNRFSPFVDQLENYRVVMRALIEGKITIDQVTILDSGDIEVSGVSQEQSKRNGRNAVEDESIATAFTQ